MSVWLTIPSAKAAPEAQACVDLWRSMGYRVALWRDQEDAVECDLKLVGKYPGYANSVNALCAEVMERHQDAQWMVAAGDDTDPDPNKRAEQIEAELVSHFGGTLGICQPTGHGHGIDTICGSPFMGREWCKRGYGGNGPLWGEYTHMFVDSDLQEVAKKLGILWQRPDLIHAHHQWQIEGRPMPAYSAKANSPDHWQRFQSLFMFRKAHGFPGHELKTA